MPERTSNVVTFGKDFAKTIVTAWKTNPAAALIVGAKIRLSQDPAFAPTPLSDPADLETQECDFSGYTAGGYTPVLSAPLNLSTTQVGLDTEALAVAAAATPFVDNQCYGWWIDDGTNLIAGEAFGDAGPVAFASPGDFLALTIFLPLALALTVA
jgi:hypothetical protein